MAEISRWWAARDFRHPLPLARCRFGRERYWPNIQLTDQGDSFGDVATRRGICDDWGAALFARQRRHSGGVKAVARGALFFGNDAPFRKLPEAAAPDGLNNA